MGPTTARSPQQKVQQDGPVVERRLRPIYEWLDNGNNKKALQEAEKVLRKTPSLQIARALRALALLRLGRAAEAHAVLDALAAEKPAEDTTLQAMTISYRESQQLRKVCEIYEAAAASDPTSETLYTQLFMSYVRVGDFRAQQKTALALYKFAPKNPYYFWAVMSIVLQAREADDAMSNVLLSLAQRMVDKFIAENKLETQQETRIYIMILELQHKYEDILKFMDSSAYYYLNPEHLHAARIPYVKKCGKIWQLNTICKALLYDNLDRWDYYVPYFDSTFELLKSGCKEESAEKCHDFICQLIERIPAKKPIRGPYLARLELYKRLREADLGPEALMGDAVDVCVEYVRVFAHKPCCVADIKPYLSMIPLDERRRRCREFLTCLGMDEHTMPETLEEVQRHVSCVGVWLLTGPPTCAGLAGTLRSHYLRALARGLAPATSTEFPAADTYAVHSARLFYIAAMEQQSSAPILEALNLLEFVLKNSPSNFHCKLLALKFYHLLGCGYGADTMYNSLEIKQMQLSSLGWLHAARLAPGALYSLAVRLHTHTHKLHTHHQRDSAEHLTYSYKYGTLDKLMELMSFVSRVERCAWCAQSALERALLELLTGAGSFSPPPQHSDILSDNRDLNIMRNYDPPHLHNPNLQEETFQHELATVALRSSIVNSIALSIELASACNGNDTDKPLDKDKILSELADWLDKFDKTFVDFKESYRCPESSDLVSSPFPSRIVGLVSSCVPYRELYAQTLGLCVPLARRDAAAAQARCEGLRWLVARAGEEFAAAVAGAGDTLWSSRRRLEELANYVELIGLITFELGVCQELASPQQSKNKKKQTNVQTPAEQKTSELLAQVNLATQEAIAALEATLAEWPEPHLPADLEEMLANLNLKEDAVRTKLVTGHEAMLNDVRSILAKKTKSLKSLL